MKKIFQWIMPVFLGIVPAMGAEEQAIKAFLAHDDATYTITRVREAEVESKLEISAVVYASFNSNNSSQAMERTIPVKEPFGYFTPTGWDHHDDDLLSRRRGQVTIETFTSQQRFPISTVYIRAEEFPYTLLGKTEGRFIKGIPFKSDDLPVGEAVQVHEISKYKRPGDLPDAAPFEKRGDLLYQLLREEIKVPGAPYRFCKREWDIFSQWQTKTRHEVQTYDTMNATSVTWQLLPTGDKVELSKTEALLLKPGQYEAEVPTCGNQVLPPNSKIVNSF